MTKEGRQIDALSEAIDVTITLECNKCNAVTVEWCMDEYDAVKIFYKMGWRFGRSNVYCPKCAKKYLQSKQQTP